uniref:COG4 transport protein middle alpha-helical bundle domain-containing protein n=1 Tax=Ananas comosus var. bracteatus TaxID=296719 RepID=A0A6V7NFB7_ANACO|nr:unnamed protein product [Ananas comosus var. bracteatus]
MAVASASPPSAPPPSDLSADGPSSPSSIDLWFPEALSQIRSLTDVGATTRLLHTCGGRDLRASLLSSSRPLLSIARSDSSLLLSSASSPSPSPSPSPPAAAGRPDFVGCLTNLFKDIVLAVQENDETLRELCSALRRGRIPGGLQEPREIEIYLEEILSLTQLGEDYTEFMDLIAFYVILEEFFMVENVRKAIKIDEHEADSLTTSMVDDVFFVLQSCLSGSTAGEDEGAQFGAKLFLGGVGVQKTGMEIATALNNIDVSAEYVLKLQHGIEQCAEAFPALADREKVKSCLSELAEISNTFKKILNAGMEQLVATVTPAFVPSWTLSLRSATSSMMLTMTSNIYDSFVHLVIDFIVKRLEVIMMQKQFSLLGGLQLDKEVRALINHFSEMSQRPVRDMFSCLSQISTILNFERVSEILDFWGENAGHLTWLLTPAEVRRILGLRIDFKPEAIAALRL